MARHRGTYKPENPEPYELSRSRLEAFLKCPACFWLDRVRGVKFPSIPAFLLNTNTDVLLKKDFDGYRGRGPHPLMRRVGLEHLRPFAHPDLETWQDSLNFGKDDAHFNTRHEATNLCFGGGVDDVWENPATGELHIVDYKSTAQMGPNFRPLDESFIAPVEDPKKPDYKAGYRRQMDMYQWVLRRRGYAVSNTGYFVYVDGQHAAEPGMLDEADPTQGWMRFAVAVIPYEGDDRWVDGALIDAKACLSAPSCPAHAEGCEHARFLKGAWEATAP
jgi:hypothetical protein